MSKGNEKNDTNSTLAEMRKQYNKNNPQEQAQETNKDIIIQKVLQTEGMQQIKPHNRIRIQLEFSLENERDLEILEHIIEQKKAVGKTSPTVKFLLYQSIKNK